MDSYQAESFKGSVEPIFCQRWTNHLGQLLKCGIAIAHTNPKRGSLEHFPIVHTVSKGDSVRRINTQIRTKAVNGCSFVKCTIDQIAVDNLPSIRILNAEIQK